MYLTITLVEHVVYILLDGVGVIMFDC